MTSPTPDAVLPADTDRCDAGQTDDKCLVLAEADIRRHLQRLLDTRTVLVGNADGAASTQVTALLHVGTKTLLVDVPRAKEVLRLWLDSPRLRFEGSIERISVGFATGPAWLDQHGGLPALGLPLPTRLRYQQRREFLRIAPPTGTLRCRVPALDAEAEAPWIEATIRDVGGGGLALLVPEGALPLALGEVLEGCVIELPQLGTVCVDLLVRHLVKRERPPGLQAGCEFVGLPAAAQDKLFRYVMQLDRERVSRRRGQE